MEVNRTKSVKLMQGREEGGKKIRMFLSFHTSIRVCFLVYQSML